jgi:hypothetical protein
VAARPRACKPAATSSKPVTAAGAKPDAKAEARQRLMAAKKAMMQKQKEPNETDVIVAAAPELSATVRFHIPCMARAQGLSVICTNNYDIMTRVLVFPAECRTERAGCGHCFR